LAGGRRAWASAGELPLVALPALLRRARLLVTGDTGPMHLAVAVGTPVVALFAVSDPAVSGPCQDLDRHVVIRKWRTCDPCLSKNCPYAEPICMDNISVDEVAAAVDGILGRKSA
jgi:ADP-heptose:LPS heptosyltransferase